MYAYRAIMGHSVRNLASRTLQHGACFILMMTLAAGMTAQDDCPYDLNGDGVTGANELLFFMSELWSRWKHRP